MPSDTELDAIAREVAAARREARHLAPFTARVAGFDLAAAYAVAARLHAAALADGARPVGRKIGFSNARLWDVYGVRDPIWGQVYDRTLVRLGGAEGRCSLGPFVDPKLEPEIVFHLRRAPSPTAGADELLHCIDWVAQGIEIVQCHYPGWRFEASDTVADASLHGVLLVGEPVPVDGIAGGGDVAAALGAFTLALSCEPAAGQPAAARGVDAASAGPAVREVEVGRGANVLGSPLAALAHLVALLARQPGAPPLEAGEIVTTGSTTMAHPVQPGERWSTAIRGLAVPDIAVRFLP